MDATVPQEDGYRFFYVLPWDERSLLIEDTRYSDRPEVDEAVFRREILAYAVKQGWDVSRIGRSEVGCLPIPLRGSAPAGERNVPRSGARAGLFHATTGYSLPEAVRWAEAFAHRSDFHGPVVAAWANDYAESHWRRQGFFRLLNRLMFRATPPEERYRILESFYRRPEAFISRFYASRLSVMDRLRMFTGTPPVPLGRALREIILGKAA